MKFSFDTESGMFRGVGTPTCPGTGQQHYGLYDQHNHLADHGGLGKFPIIARPALQREEISESSIMQVYLRSLWVLRNADHRMKKIELRCHPVLAPAFIGSTTPLLSFTTIHWNLI